MGLAPLPPFVYTFQKPISRIQDHNWVQERPKPNHKRENAMTKLPKPAPDVYCNQTRHGVFGGHELSKRYWNDNSVDDMVLVGPSGYEQGAERKGVKCSFETTSDDARADLHEFGCLRN